jgi:hypothetical protein
MTLLVTSALCAQQSAPLIELKATDIDAYPQEHLLALRVDTMGRLFVGARNHLYVYEPKKEGGYEPRKLLYRFPPAHAWISDIEVRGDNLYVLTQTALYVFVDGVRKRGDLLPRKLIWGVPWSQHYQGFKALAWGPEGDLYFALGGPCPADRLAYWSFFTQPEGTRVPYRGVGGVFRCKPDGSELRVVAHGLRHPGGLAFDRHWNLFTTDRTDKAWRTWHVTPHARLDQLEPMFGDVGTVGPWYIDEPALPRAMREQLILVERGKYVGHTLKPRGASFEAVPTITMPDAAGAVSVDGGGRIFALVSQKHLRRLSNADDPKAHAFEPYEASEATPERLWQEMSTPSWQRRSRAHVELMRRGGDLLKEANKRLLGAKADDPALHHLIWLAARSGQGSLHLLSLIEHADPKVRVQTIRALSEFPEQLRDEPIFTKSLLDTDAQVRHAAVSAYFHPKVAFDRAVQQAIERGPACDKDPYLRQMAALLFAQKATLKQIEDLCGRQNAALRRAGVLAAGFRLTLPPQTAPAQHLKLGEISNGEKIAYADGEVKLREHGRVGLFTLAWHWKEDMHTVEQEALFKLLRKMLADEEEVVRAQAARFLALLDDPRAADEVKRVLNKQNK